MKAMWVVLGFVMCFELWTIPNAHSKTLKRRKRAIPSVFTLSRQQIPSDPIIQGVLQYQFVETQVIINGTSFASDQTPENCTVSKPANASEAKPKTDRKLTIPRCRDTIERPINSLLRPGQNTVEIRISPLDSRKMNIPRNVRRVLTNTNICQQALARFSIVSEHNRPHSSHATAKPKTHNDETEVAQSQEKTFVGLKVHWSCQKPRDLKKPVFIVKHFDIPPVHFKMSTIEPQHSFLAVTNMGIEGTYTLNGVTILRSRTPEKLPESVILNNTVRYYPPDWLPFLQNGENKLSFLPTPLKTRFRKRHVKLEIGYFVEGLKPPASKNSHAMPSPSVFRTTINQRRIRRLRKKPLTIRFQVQDYLQRPWNQQDTMILDDALKKAAIDTLIKAQAVIGSKQQSQIEPLFEVYLNDIKTLRGDGARSTILTNWMNNISSDGFRMNPIDERQLSFKLLFQGQLLQIQAKQSSALSGINAAGEQIDFPSTFVLKNGNLVFAL